MSGFRIGRLHGALVFTLVSLGLATAPFASAAQTVVPEGTKVFLALSKTVTSRKKETAIGDLVPARVWRDVVVDGQVVIKRGTKALSMVASVKSNKILGIKGAVSILAIETTTADGQVVHLTGGYHEEGKGRMSAAIGFGVLIGWAFLFTRGMAAELPAGTVVGSYTSETVFVSAAEQLPQGTAVGVGSARPAFSVDVIYDLLVDVKHPTNFDFLITADKRVPAKFAVDAINGTEVEPINLTVLSVVADDESALNSIRAIVEIKQLADRFRKGINSFEISYYAGGRRVAEEVVLEIDF